LVLGWLGVSSEGHDVHELTITRRIVDAVAARAEGRAVTKVTVEIGRLSGVVPDAVAFCFDVCAEGTAVEGAELAIVETAGRGRCRACATDFAMTTLYDACPACGRRRAERIAGEELNILSFEMRREREVA